jgi:hypothetical protein
MDGRGEHDGRWNGRGERERRASDDRWIAFGMALIAVGVGYVGRNIGKVSQSIENVSDSIKAVSESIKAVGESINNASAVWEDSNKKRLECRRIKCFEGIRCEIVTNREVLQEKIERR